MSDQSKKTLDLLHLLGQYDENPEDLSDALGLPEEAVEEAMRGATITSDDDLDCEDDSPLSNREILERQLDSLQRLYEIADFAYQGDPTDRNAAAVTMLMNTAQAIIKELDSSKDSKDVYKDILKIVIQPLVRDLIKAVTEESSNLRAVLTTSLPPELLSKVDHAVKEHVTAFGKAAKLSYEGSTSKLASTLNVVDSKKEDAATSSFSVVKK